MADLKFQELTENTSPISTDIFPTVDDPAGTPLDRKVTMANAITKASGMSDGVVVASSGVLSGDSTPDLGTPSAVVLTNATGTAASLTAGVATLATTATGTNALYSATTTVDVVSATAPTSGQVLTATGDSAATWQSPAGGTIDTPADYFAQSRIILIDNYQQTTGSTVNQMGCGIDIRTAATSATSCSVDMELGFLDGGDISDKAPKWYARLDFGSAADQDGWMGIFETAVSPAHGNTYTTDHVGFLVADSALVCSVADGSTQQKSADLSGTYPVTTNHSYYITPNGSNYEFYIDGVLVHTSSANNPNSNLDTSAISVKTSANAIKSLKVYQHTISFDE